MSKNANTRTMVDVQNVIDARRALIAESQFVRSLDRVSTVREVRAFVSHLGFWVMAFQDILRLIEKFIENPQLAVIARRLREEDEGHDKWFLHDAKLLGCPQDIEWIFAVDRAMPRDVSYQLISEIIHAKDDRERFAMLYVLEAAGGEFIGRVAGALERAEFTGKLQYFCRHHQQVEEDHDLFSEAGHAELKAIPVDDETYERTVQLVSRSFDIMEELADYLEQQRIVAESEM